MAVDTLNAKSNKDLRYGVLIEEMVCRTGLSKAEVETKIFELAVGP
jgi:hypothetical protein